ncbi:MAG: RNase adapter RapZ [Synergistetes bacterium]|nr:RNase adapter RapZ [Synergistota bacterium]
MFVVVVTGLSGAGKSFASKVFEDMGYFCVDNLPPVLISKVVDLCMRSDNVNRIALVVDLRVKEFFNSLYPALDELSKMGIPYKILFLDASDEVIVRRYKETRRKHPLDTKGGMVESIKEERRLLERLKERADIIIDTSDKLPQEFASELVELFQSGLERRRLMIVITSFGFKYGVPRSVDLLFDVRFLPNPYYLDSLRDLSGKDSRVIQFLSGYDVTENFIGKLVDMLLFLLPLYEKEGKSYLYIAFGCTGGKHRSVYLADRVYVELKNAGYTSIVVEHRDLGKE